MMRLKTILRWTGVGSILLFGAAATFYLRDIRAAYARIQDTSTLLPSPHGDIEFTEGGSGPPVLVIHGSGGGFDQAELIAEAVLGDDVRWITPSRFGYLRSTFHEGATFDDQAHAYAFLLDSLGIEQVAVVTMSHGGPSALLFAALYPERVSSLTLISAGVAASTVVDQTDANRKGDMLVRLYASDLLYWTATTMFRNQFMRLMGANDDVIARLSPQQRELATRIIDDMNPASPRAAGAAFDNTAAMPNERIASIQAPTLILHAKDDALQLFHNAEFAAATIPGARLRSWDHGGHLLIVIEQATIRDVVQQHINTHRASISAERGGRRQ
jgi:pimeloyl-ACP methyl ester carboxylesterase